MMLGNLSKLLTPAALGIQAWRKRKRFFGAQIRKGALYELLSQAGFQVVDVGARGGPMQQLFLLAPFAQYFACEPDTEEAQKLCSLVNQHAPWKGVTVFSEALSTQVGKATLYICNQPGLSSLLQPNWDVVRRYYDDGRFEVCRELTVPTITLDDAAERYGFAEACFIKLDTQGTELDILRSGQKLISKAVLGLHVEVEFHPFYRNQALFSDVDAYLRSLGFCLIDLQRTLIRRASCQGNLYSRRQLVWGDALYLKEPSVVISADDRSSMLRLSRLLGLALVFEQFDLACEITTSAMTTPYFQNEWSETIKQEIERLAFASTKAAKKVAKSRRQRPKPVKFMYTDRNRV